MDETSAIAEWIRQRAGETDAEWLERLAAVFGVETFQPPLSNEEAAKASRVGERLWSRYLTTRSRLRDVD